MLTPKEVFDNPLQYVDFLQSADFEGQYFERKEVRIDTNNQINALKDKIKQCISAFSNSNRGGGLLALGIADDGTIIGTQHVDEQTINSILQVARDLSNHATQLKEVVLPNSDGKRLHFLYTPWTSNAICETVGNFPQAWKRVGAQCLALTEQDREQLKREKKIIDFETSYCCPYDPDELDIKVVEEFKKVYLDERDAQYDYTTEEVLYKAGALMKENDKYAFTNAGFLFFASNPRRLFASAYVRVLRFEVNVEESRTRGVTTFDKRFDGPLPNIIRKLRTFFRDSALFRTMIRRSSNGGFIEDPEYPLFAVDEAVVNAIIHKDYSATTATHCIAYQNGFVVKNPGGIPQEVPRHFSLADTALSSVLRNQRLVEWMRLFKDERGEPLVRALSEGTRKMRQEMENLGLPAPDYETAQRTTVTLYNRFDERLAPHAAYTSTEPKLDTPPEHGNLKSTAFDRRTSR
jgi:predicted HTH transcriptional regulator